MKFNFRWKELILVGISLLLIWKLGAYLFGEKDFSQNIVSKLGFEDNLYVYSAYRVYDDEIRIVTVKSHLSGTRIFYSFDVNLPAKLLHLECQREGECPAVFTPKCLLSGYVGTIKDKEMIGRELKEILLMNEGTSLKVKVRDVRQSSVKKRKHQLGVCVQPVFLHTDWSQFIQFFEYWLSEGATKFYVYLESYTNEVKRVLDFYTANSRAEIQLINWSKLPHSSINTETDPNFYWYRLEAFMAIFDCMHRARNHVHFVAQSDLDEIFQVSSSNSLLQYLHWLEFRHPAMASANFMSRRVKIPTYWDQIKSPEKLNFSPFLEAELETKVFKRPLYMKNIYVPERVKRFDIHFQRSTETISSRLNLSYTHLNVSQHHALVLHLRRTDEALFSWSGAAHSKELTMMAHKMEINYLRRLQADRTGLLSSQQNWSNVGAQVIQTIENCRQEQYKLKMEKCYSLSNCEALVFEKFENLKWHRAKNTWSVLS